MQTVTTEPTIYATRGEAEESARAFNCATVDRARELRVVVEGPEDGSWWNFDLSEAIDCGFVYSWEA